MEKTMDKIIALAKARGFVSPGSEIYGGLANTWDYGNLGVELKNNVKRANLPNLLQHKLLHHMSHTVVVVGIGNKVCSFPHRKHRILHRYT